MENLKNLAINISELSFLMNWEDERASYYFKNACSWHGLTYKPKMRLTLEQLSSSRENLKVILDKALDIHNHYFQRYEGRMKLLNENKCIETGRWGDSGNARIKVFLKAEDIEKIEAIWKTKREQFYSQTGLFDVKPTLYTPKKSNRKKSEAKTQKPT